MQALTTPKVVSQVLFIAERSQIETRTSGNQDAGPLTLRATKMTDVLKKILEHSCYTHGGLND
jgi:hypothetical protein